MRNSLYALALWACLLATAHGEEPVFFADANLKAAVEETLWVSDPTPTDMLSLTSLNYTQQWFAEALVVDLTGLEYATNLQTLYLRLNRINDISPLSGLIHLTTIDVSQNEISDLLPLSGLANLTSLNLHGNQISDTSPLSALGNLEELVLRLNGIHDISPLSALTNLQTLNLANNRISDLSPLAGLTRLSALSAWCNNVKDISPLAGLERLRTLSISGNRISNVSPLSDLENLTDLDLEGNSVSNLSPLSGLQNLSDLNLTSNWVNDISPLSGLMSLLHLELRGNKLNQEAYDTYIPQLIANNPGITINYDPMEHTLSTSSTRGGSVVTPGEGEFTYSHGTCVWVEAEADSDYVFAGWSGSSSAAQNPLSITMEQDCQICACFVSALDVLHVDANAPDDPEADDPNVSDPQENGTADHPFDSIQEAIDVATDGVAIIIRPGVYQEHINLRGKKIDLAAVDPASPQGGPCATIDGTDGGPAVSIPAGSGTQCSLRGFIITKSKSQIAAALCCTGSSPTISNCLVVGNRTTQFGGAAIHCSNSEAVFVNCTIADNDIGDNGTGLQLVNSNITLWNSILWGNEPNGNELALDETSQLFVGYTNIAESWDGTGNIPSDPLFAHQGYWMDPLSGLPTEPDNLHATWVAGDYHLKSQMGRWDPETERWVQDDVTSLCIDGGDPLSDVGQELDPNGGVINMGAYGGTIEASLGQ